jgi:hypothetical protein
MSDEIVLPRKDKDGNYYISYSQISSFLSDKGFNTGLPGSLEYIQRYFLGKDWPDAGWALFGAQVEDYICYRDYSIEKIREIDKELGRVGEETIENAIKSFSYSEQDILNEIEPLGTYQRTVKLWIYDNVYVYGFIDDCTDDYSIMRDYKTGSKTSVKQYSTDKYKQLDIYSLFALQETGKIPEKLEVCAIERKGNCFGMTNRRDLLSVGKEVWWIERSTSKEKLEVLKLHIEDTIKKISDLYKIFLKTNVNV